MIFNKKFIMYFSICLLVFNKQSLASAPVDVDSNSLASALELASVVEKQVEADNNKSVTVKVKWKDFAEKGVKYIDNKRLKEMKNDAAKTSAKRAEAKKAKELADKAAKEELAYKILTNLYVANQLSYDDAKKYIELYKENKSVSGFSIFEQLFKDLQTYFVWNESNKNKTYYPYSHDVVDN